MSSLRVPRAAASAAVVRRRMVAELLAHGVPVAVVDDAALVLSELLGNAVRHGADLPGGGIRADWSLGEGGLRLEVRDGGSGPQRLAAAAAGSHDGESGRGLGIVASLARRWGHDATGVACVVWAELALGSGGPVPDLPGDRDQQPQEEARRPA